jgi:hypothetical protein
MDDPEAIANLKIRSVSRSFALLKFVKFIMNNDTTLVKIPFILALKRRNKGGGNENISDRY